MMVRGSGRFVNRPYEGLGVRDDVGIVPYEGDADCHAGVRTGSQ